MPSHIPKKHRCKTSKLRVLIFLVGMLLTPFMTVAQAQQIGYVINLEGDWVLNSSQQLKSGSPVTAGGLVQLSQPKKNDFIEVVDQSGKPIKSLNCNINDCRNPYRLPRVIHTNIILRIVKVGMEMLFSEPSLPLQVPAISRGVELREAVVKIVDQQVDLSSVLANVRPGKYLLRFEPIGASTPPDAKPIGPITVDWNPDKPSIVSVEGLSFGLYIVQPLSTADRELLEPGSESMVLFVRPEIFERNSGEFGEAVKVTDSWGASVRHTSKRKFVRAVLAQLDSEARR
jgi:hypothetical protein